MGEPWHLGLICSFDLETTGTDVESDRIVTACCTWLDGSGRQAPVVRDWLAWPGIDIPEAASKVHGVTTGHAREHGLPAAQVVSEVADTLLEAIAGELAIVVYNAPYDLTLLDRECARYGLDLISPHLGRALVFDPLVMDKALDRYRPGSRQLTDVAAHYGVKAGKAHDAGGDALTAARVAWKIAATHPAARTGRDQLMAFQRSAAITQASSFAAYLRSKGRDAEAAGVSGAWPWRPPAVEAVA